MRIDTQLVVRGQHMRRWKRLWTVLSVSAISMRALYFICSFLDFARNNRIWDGHIEWLQANFSARIPEWVLLIVFQRLCHLTLRQNRTFVWLRHVKLLESVAFHWGTQRYDTNHNGFLPWLPAVNNTNIVEAGKCKFGSNLFSILIESRGL
jgi:hypothetical protein